MSHLGPLFPLELFLFLVPVPDRRWDIAGAPSMVVVLALTKKKVRKGIFFAFLHCKALGSRQIFAINGNFLLLYGENNVTLGLGMQS